MNLDTYAQACDCHSHIYGPEERFPYLPNLKKSPPKGTLEMYQAMSSPLGFERAVFVQPAVYGTDHSAILHALEQGGGRYRAVAIVDGTESDVTLAQYDEAGICGIRFNYWGHLGNKPDDGFVREMSERISEKNWQVYFHLDEESVVEKASLIASLKTPVVIDHMARIDMKSENAGAINALYELSQLPNAWTKISAADRIVENEMQLRRVIPRMQAIYKNAPERTLWGFDWPHPNSGWLPDEKKLYELFLEVFPENDARENILVHNPNKLYFSDNKG